MKFAHLTALMLLILFSKISIAQSNLYGTWKVSCTTKQTSTSTAQFCALCPIKQTDASSLEVTDFEMTINEAEITLTIDSVATPVKYKWNKKSQTILFEYKTNSYEFTLLPSKADNQKVLKEKSGTLITLYKK